MLCRRRTSLPSVLRASRESRSSLVKAGSWETLRTLKKVFSFIKSRQFGFESFWIVLRCLELDVSGTTLLSRSEVSPKEGLPMIGRLSLPSEDGFLGSGVMSTHKAFTSFQHNNYPCLMNRASWYLTSPILCVSKSSCHAFELVLFLWYFVTIPPDVQEPRCCVPLDEVRHVN